MEPEHKDIQVLASIGTVDENHTHHEPAWVKVVDSDIDNSKKPNEPSTKEDKKEHIETTEHAFKVMAKGNDEHKLDEKSEEKLSPRKLSSSSSSSVDSLNRKFVPSHKNQVEEQDKPNMAEPLKQSKMDFIKSKIPESIKSVNKKTLIGAAAVSERSLSGRKEDKIR
ncbi:hypothetical protein SteCoe_1269 [Stentor coeruleus]|uniref:Uncharacterized protein n=1 Tax=Stentor coeruleus TaxID=5963 RepID=A0A1R2D2C6_9CILI|nr:hypothetical protein SteCoe_1269 [Stentor coeruleus]